MTAFVPNGPVREDDPAYQQAIAEEAAFWADPATVPLLESLASAALGPMKRHHNLRFTGFEDRAWFDCVPARGPFARALVLGCGTIAEETIILEQNAACHFTFCDVDASGLSRRAAVLGERFPGRVATRQIDLNFAELESNSFDLIVSASTLHHLVNLEALARQINRALTEGGWFFLHDLTCVSGMRFSEEHKRIFDVICERERVRRGNNDFPIPRWCNVDNYAFSPFEAVRSGDILGALAASIDEVARAQTGTILTLVMFTDLVRDLDTAAILASARQRTKPGQRLPNIWELTLSEECIRELCLFDDIVTDALMFPAMNTFAQYRKKP